MTTPATSATTPASRPVRFRRFLRDVLIAALLLGAGLGLYARKVSRERDAHRIGLESRPLLAKDTLKDYAEAEKRLLEMERLSPDHPFAVSCLAELYAVRWLDFGLDADAPRARAWLERAEKLDERIDERLGAMVLRRLAEGRFAEAEHLASELAQSTAASHVLSGLGRAQRALGKRVEARVALRRAADGDWRSARFAADLGTLLLEEGDWPGAFGAFVKGLEANSGHARSMIGRARASIARGERMEESRGALQELLEKPLVELPPRLRALALVASAELALAEQKPDAALTLAREAAGTDPKSAWAPFALGRALAAKKDAGAAEAFRQAVSLDPVVPHLYLGAASELSALKDFASARALLDSYTRALPKDTRYHRAYAALLSTMGQPDEALAQLEQALALDPFDGDARLAKGTLLFQKRDFAAAREELEKAGQARDLFPDAWSKLGEVLFEQRQWAEGCQHYGQALLQMRQLGAPLAKVAQLRDAVNGRLTREQPALAKAWMDETAGLSK